ncbi:UNKNOWN [Stylonychia lemnae]|uniref:BCCIP family protein n=1 Tax=Stylonychia lemnae TaxID=5949 RepID=A0A078BBV5_STYLE|nr:UNKNOWN [Stylonychia lemnae]|eukprot:CDW91073.1 UNKNOWN [Stylonychia lemnae]
MSDMSKDYKKNKNFKSQDRHSKYDNNTKQYESKSNYSQNKDGKVLGKRNRYEELNQQQWDKEDKYHGKEVKGDNEESKEGGFNSDSSEEIDLYKQDKKKGEVINVEFELVLPCETYYHTVRALLSQYLDGEEQEKLDLSGLADLVVSCISIGSVVASALELNPEDDPQYKHLNDEDFQKVVNKLNTQRDVYGFTTVLSLTRRKNQHKCFQQIIDYVTEKANKHCNDKQKDQLTTILNKKNAGILLNERLINLPFMELVPQLHSSLPEDIKFTKKQDDIEDPREFDYQYLLCITRYTIENEKRDGLKKQKTEGGNTKLYYKAEDELFSRHAEVSFSFKTIFRETMQDGQKKNIVGGGSGAPETHYKMIYLIKYSEYEKRLKEIANFF